MVWLNQTCSAKFILIDGTHLFIKNKNNLLLAQSWEKKWKLGLKVECCQPIGAQITWKVNLISCLWFQGSRIGPLFSSAYRMRWIMKALCGFGVEWGNDSWRYNITDESLFSMNHLGWHTRWASRISESSSSPLWTVFSIYNFQKIACFVFPVYGTK